MDVRWRIDERVRAEVHFFTGLGFSGNHEMVRIFVGGRRQGPAIDGSRVKSVGIIAPFGTRLVLSSAEMEEGWEEQPWRAIVLVSGSSFKHKDGRDAVQVPDLDVMDAPAAKRSDPDFVAGFPQVTDPKDGSGWTYGLADFHRPLKGNVRTVRLDLVKVK